MSSDDDEQWGPGERDPSDELMAQDAPDLGSCCVCAQRAPDVVVRTIVQLRQRAPMAGRGWGCLVCGLPPDGALAVVCDGCAPDEQSFTPAALIWACRGYPGLDGRVPIGALVGEHAHDGQAHARDEATQDWLDADDEPDLEPDDEREPVYPADYFKCHRCGMMAEGPALMVWPEDESFLWELCNDCFGRLTGHRITYPQYQRKRDDPHA